MWFNEKLAGQNNFTHLDRNMYFLHLVFCYLTVYNISEGKIVQGIIGRNLSFSWTFENIRNDNVFILHNETRFHQVSAPQTYFPPSTLLDGVKVSISYIPPDNVTVTVDFLNITENDAGKYRVVRQWKSQDLDESVHLITIGINHYTTTAVISKEDTEEFPSKSHLLNILLGAGIILAVAMLSCVLHKIRTCLGVARLSNRNTDDGDVNLHEEISSGNYWTVVSNVDGELSSAIETDFEQRREQLPIGKNMASAPNKSEQLVGSNDVKLNEELDSRRNPVHSLHVQFDDYIHPVHSDPVNSQLVPTHQSAAFCNTLSYETHTSRRINVASASI